MARELGTLAVPVVLSIPVSGAAGQLVSYLGTLFQYTGSSWVSLNAPSGLVDNGDGTFTVTTATVTAALDMDAQTLYWMSVGS